MNNKTKSIVILILIAVVFTAFAFLVPFPKTPALFIAYITGLIAIALQIPIFKMSFDGRDQLNSKFLGFPVFRVGYYYLGIQMALSLLIFALGFIGFPAWLAALLCIIVLCGAVACSIAADVARETNERIEYKQKADTGFMTQLRERASALVNLTSDSELKTQLQKLSEDIRFSDPVSSPAIANEEQALSSTFNALETAVKSGSENTSELCEEVARSLAVRNGACKANKQ